MDKKIKKTAKIAIVTAIITIIILVCILTIFKFEYDKTGICSDPEKSFKWFINCVNPESLIKLIIYMSGLGVAPLILSNISCGSNAYLEGSVLAKWHTANMSL